MKRKKINKALVLIALLVVATVVAAAVHLSTRESVTEGTIQIVTNDERHEVLVSELQYEKVVGTCVNGKGDKIEIDGQGILLNNLLALYEFDEYDEISVVADDSYSASLTREEVEEDGKVYLLAQEEEELRLIVFGDENSKRNVSNVVQIVVK